MNGDLKWAVCDNMTGSSAILHIFDRAGDAGQDNLPVQTTSGNPLICYRDPTTTLSAGALPRRIPIWRLLALGRVALTSGVGLSVRNRADGILIDDRINLSRMKGRLIKDLNPRY